MLSRLTRMLRRGAEESRAAALNDIFGRYTDSLASGTTDATGVAVLRAVADAISSPFFRASIAMPQNAPRTPVNGVWAASVAQTLTLAGNSVYALDVGNDGAVMLTPAASWEIAGTEDPSSWVYSLELAQPSGDSRQTRRPAAGVVHFRIGARDSSPWAGVPAWKGLTGDIAQKIEQSLVHDASTPVAAVVSTPDQATLAQRRGIAMSIKEARGRAVVEPAMTGGWGTSNSGTPRDDYKPVRIGPDVPPQSIALRESVAHHVAAAYGVIIPHAQASGPGLRECRRQNFINGTMKVASIIEAELSAKVGPTVISFPAHDYVDIAMRVRALDGLLNAGYTLKQASEIAGIPSPRPAPAPAGRENVFAGRNGHIADGAYETALS